jgi:tRNA(fMet)-specific endonuclease VapC
MKYLLDTAICSTIIKHPQTGRSRFEKVAAGDIALSSITWAELQAWVSLNTKAQERLLSLQRMFAPIVILPFTAEDAGHFGPIQKYLKNRGALIGALDMMIAAHAISRDLIVVTNNVSHFSRVPGLRIENWAERK